jgi:hypothetical protein
MAELPAEMPDMGNLHYDGSDTVDGRGGVLVTAARLLV